MAAEVSVPIFGPKGCVWQGKPELVFCTKLELLDSTIATISRGSHNFGMHP